MIYSDLYKPNLYDKIVCKNTMISSYLMLQYQNQLRKMTLNNILPHTQHADEKIESNFDVHEKDTQNWMWCGLGIQEQLSEKSNIGAP